jgi:pimeloyl-ACP methyl ester carboxylesterase
MFVSRSRDPVYHWPGVKGPVDQPREVSMPNLTGSTVLEGCGHWTQQERPQEVNRLLLE